MKTTIPTQYIIDYLLNRGCSHWKNYGLERIYLDENLIHLLLNVEATFDGTGNITGYTYDGKKLSKLDYNRMLAELDTKIYYDVADATYKTKDPCSYADDIFKRLQDQIEAQYKIEHKVLSD